MDTVTLFNEEEVGPAVRGEGAPVFPGGFVGGVEGCVVGGGCGNLKEQQMVAQGDALDMGGSGSQQSGGYRRKRKTRRYRRKQRGGKRRATTQKRASPFFLKLRVSGGVSLKQRGR